MKSKSAGFYASSLEMLLDTMCNMLGGVVFIALMVAVVARDSTTHTPPTNQSPQIDKDLAAVTASNNMVELELQSILKRLQDPRLRPQTNIMRLPNIANTPKQPWIVIMQHGKAYPLDIFSVNRTNVAILNKEAILFQPQSRYFETRPGKGLDPQESVTNMARTFRAFGNTNYYFAFLVFNDSFDAFIRARETATKLGYQYGWDPLPANQRLQAGPQGERVLPQN